MPQENEVDLQIGIGEISSQFLLPKSPQQNKLNLGKITNLQQDL